MDDGLHRARHHDDIPGLALFYGGMVRSKNMLSVLMQVFVAFCLIAVVWVHLRLLDRLHRTATRSSAASTGCSCPGRSTEATRWRRRSSKGVAIPELVFVAFQLTFAAITCALIVGSFAERIKFSATLVFVVLWFTFAYAPIAHMVWYWDGPDADHRCEEPRRGDGRRPAGCGRRARSISRAARWCTSTPASPAWWAPT